MRTPVEGRGSRVSGHSAFAKRHCLLESLEGDHRARVEDFGDGLHLLRHEMADIDLGVQVELGDDVVIACGRVDFRCDLGIVKRACDLVGLAELALALDEEGLHSLGLRGHVEKLSSWALKLQSSIEGLAPPSPTRPVQVATRARRARRTARRRQLTASWVDA